MTARRVGSAAEAAAFIQATDSVAVGLGPAHPGGFLHALGDRDDWEDLQLFGALLTDLYSVFMKEGVHYRSGFFGPAERFLRDSGADIQYVPADFRRFGPIVEQLAPRVMATAVVRSRRRGLLLALAARRRAPSTSCTGQVPIPTDCSSWSTRRTTPGPSG